MSSIWRTVKVAILLQLAGGASTEVIEESEHVGFTHGREEVIQGAGFGGEFDLELSQVAIEVRGHGKLRPIGEMKLIDGVHFHPAGGEAQVHQKLAGHGVWIAEQGVEVRGRVKRVAFAPEHTAIAADHIMLFDQEDAQPTACDEVGADQPSDAGADDHHIVGALWVAP